MCRVITRKDGTIALTECRCPEAQAVSAICQGVTIKSIGNSMLYAESALHGWTDRDGSCSEIRHTIGRLPQGNRGPIGQARSPRSHGQPCPRYNMARSAVQDLAAGQLIQGAAERQGGAVCKRASSRPAGRVSTAIASAFQWRRANVHAEHSSLIAQTARYHRWTVGPSWPNSSATTLKTIAAAILFGLGQPVNSVMGIVPRFFATEKMLTRSTVGRTKFTIQTDPLPQSGCS